MFLRIKTHIKVKFDRISSMEDNLDFLGSYKGRLKGSTYQEKLKSLFWNIKAIYNLGWNIPNEDKEECKVVLLTAEDNLEEGDPLTEKLEKAKEQFERIIGRDCRRIDNLVS